MQDKDKDNNHKTSKNISQNNLNGKLSKPSFLITSNPDRFLQSSNRKTINTLREREEMNPEMAEIIQKILLKRKKEKKNVNNYNNYNFNSNNNYMIKSRKIDSMKKYFDDIYNKKHILNKEKYNKLNQTLVFDSLHDRMNSENSHVNYFDFINKNIHKNKNKKNNKLNISCNNYARKSRNEGKNLGNLKSKNEYNANTVVNRVSKKLSSKDNEKDNDNFNENEHDNKLSNSLNLEEYEEYCPKDVKKIKIIKNNQYILNLNSITIDVDQINKDKNLMEINCDSLGEQIINTKLAPQNNNNIQKNIVIQQINNIRNESKEEIPTKHTYKQTPLMKNYRSDVRVIDFNNNNSSTKNKPFSLEKRNIFNDIKIKSKQHKYNRRTVNRSQENRNKYNINNKNMNDSNFYKTMGNGFYMGNLTSVHKINPSSLGTNDYNKKMKLNSYKRNKKAIVKKNIMKNEFILKAKKDGNCRKYQKRLLNNKSNYNQNNNNNDNNANNNDNNINNANNDNNANNVNNINNFNNVNNVNNANNFNNVNNVKIVNNVNNVNNVNIYKKRINVQRIKSKLSPHHSKNNSNISTEKLNNKKKEKLNDKMNNYGQNRSLSKDCFQTDQVLNNNNNNNLENNSAMLGGNKSDIFNKSSNKINNSTKKEYPNMAKFIYGGRRPNNQIINEEEVRTSKNRETKAVNRIESLCKKGYSGPGVKKTNQDNFFIYNNFNNNSNYIYLGVCDGHGLFGQDISTYLVNNLPQNMNNNVISKGIKNLSTEKITTLSNLFQETFVQTNMKLNEDERIDSSFSGSTCVSLLFTPTRICCINVGDSRCIIGKFDGYDWKSKVLSRDHKPSEPDEMNRIFKSGGRVESFRDNFGNFVGPERVWDRHCDGPGLAMSRSFGDEIAHKIGVIVDPEIMEYFFLKEDKFIILGSDGIWEFISNDEVVEIVKDYYLENNIEGAIEYLYNESSKRWIMEEGVIDDITIIIIFLK